MAAAIPFMMLAGAVVSAVGATQTAKAQRTAALFNARMDEQNAAIAAEQANAEALRLKRVWAKHEGSMVAQTGASGVTEEGSPLAALADSAAAARLDEETILYRGRLRSMGYYNQATLNRMSADTAREQGEFVAASSFLTGIGRAGAVTTASTRLTPAPSRATSAAPYYDDF